MPAIRQATLSTTGMIATPHYLASGASLKVLQDGGSAMDAVIAANAVLTVLYPDQTAIGGDCFFLVFDAAKGKVEAFNGSGPASMEANPEALRDQGYDGLPGKGALTVTVPGTIDAWFQGHDRFGKLAMEDIFRAAVGYARDGYPVSPRLGAVLANQGDLIWSWPGLASLMYPDGVVPDAGSTLRNPNLARSLERIAKDGRDAFYTGPIAEEIVAAVSDNGGWLTEADLSGYQGEWLEPLSREYNGTTVLTMPPNSQGIAVLMELGMIGFEDAPSRWGTPDGVNVQIEAANRAYAQRNQFIGDPRFIEIDTNEMLSDAYLREVWSGETGTSPGRDQRADGDTVYLCAVDRDGNAVSMIQSLFGAFGSGIVAGDTGIILQNRGTSFNLREGSANELQPGKRPRHTLMPSMLMQEEQLLGPIGTQGGDPQAQIQLQLITNVLDFGMDPQEAIDAPRWIISGAGTSDYPEILIESGFGGDAIAGLRARGRNVTVIDPFNPNAGHAQMILVDQERGVLTGGADPRADGAALGQ